MIYKDRRLPEVKPWQRLLFGTARKGSEFNAWVVMGKETDAQRNGTKIYRKKAEGKSSALSVASELFAPGGGALFLVPFFFFFVFFSSLFQ